MNHYADIVDAAARVLSARWRHLGAVECIHRTIAGENLNSRTFRVRLKAAGESQEYLLKCVVEDQAARLAKACQLQHLAVLRGVSAPAVVSPESASEGEWTAGYAGARWAVQEWRDGRTPQCGGPESTAIAEELARLHVALRGEVVPAESADYEDLSAAEQRDIRRSLRGQQHAEGNAAATILDQWPEWQRRMREIAGASRVQPVHLDCHAANVLVDEAGRPTLLDFESVVSEPRMLAIGFACSRIAGYDRALGAQFIAAYDAIDSLSPDERRLWPLFAAREAMRRVSYVLRSVYGRGDQTWEFELSRQAGYVAQGLVLA